MKALIQRVSSSKVYINNKKYSSINEGLLIFLGIHIKDNQSNAQILANKIINLRIFPGDNKKMDKSLVDIYGSALVVSQFTLCANHEKGRRPSFSNAASPEVAKSLYLCFIKEIENNKISVQSGKFQSNMAIHLINEGPVTFIIES